MTDSIETAADVAARYLKALLARDVPHTDAVNMTNSYMSSRAIMAGQSKPSSLRSASVIKPS